MAGLLSEADSAQGSRGSFAARAPAAAAAQSTGEPQNRAGSARRGEAPRRMGRSSRSRWQLQLYLRPGERHASPRRKRAQAARDLLIGLDEVAAPLGWQVGVGRPAVQ